MQNFRRWRLKLHYPKINNVLLDDAMCYSDYP